jgi:hypothetical protein
MQMRTVLLMLASILPAGYAVASETPVNLVGDPGFEKQPDADRGAWAGTQNAGKPTFERSGERPHSGQIAAKVTCRTGDVYSPYAGRVEVQYRPADVLRVATQREIRVPTSVGSPARLQVERLPNEGR